MLLKIAQHNLFLLFSKFSQEYIVSVWSPTFIYGGEPHCAHERLLQSHRQQQHHQCSTQAVPSAAETKLHWETISSEMPGKSIFCSQQICCLWNLEHSVDEAAFHPLGLLIKTFCFLQWATYSVLICWRTWENQGNFHTTWDQPLLQNQKIQDWSIKQNNVWNLKSILVQLLSFIMYKPSMMY